jgi:hypothetical protein
MWWVLMTAVSIDANLAIGRNYLKSNGLLGLGAGWEEAGID